MLDKNKRTKRPDNTTIAYLIELLKEFPANAKISVCGVFGGYIHETVEGDVVSFDTDDLEAEYEED